MSAQNKIDPALLNQVLQQTQSRKHPTYKPQKIGILGAGMMGAGIAFVAAKAGLQVILKELSLELAEAGKNHVQQTCIKMLERGKINEAQQEQLLSLIQPTANIADLQGVDFIIEAVFEDKKLKASVSMESFPYLKKNGLFASNTTSLPISDLAEAIPAPQFFLGMHFFSPVDRMPLLEIIVGKKTSAESLQKAISISHILGKTPIIVQDSPGFFTSRIFFNYLLEAIIMRMEGIAAEQIELEAKHAGFAIGPLAVLDEISIPLMLHVYAQLPHLNLSQQRCYTYLSKMVQQGRRGRKSGKGFYTYTEDNQGKELWTDVDINPSLSPLSAEIIQQRLLNSMALDSYRCLAEGVIASELDGNIGSVLGVGYPASTGGVFQYIRHIGIDRFTAQCKSFRPYGPQWEFERIDL